MKDKKFEQLKKDINYAHLEGFIPEDQQFLLFRNPEEAIQAIRDNKIPGINWTSEDEDKWIQELKDESNATE
jgi:hypothetical protein